MLLSLWLSLYLVFNYSIILRFAGSNRQLSGKMVDQNGNVLQVFGSGRDIFTVETMLQAGTSFVWWMHRCLSPNRLCSQLVSTLARRAMRQEWTDILCDMQVFFLHLSSFDAAYIEMYFLSKAWCSFLVLIIAIKIVMKGQCRTPIVYLGSRCR